MASSNNTRSHQSGEDDNSGQSTTIHRALQAVDEAMLTTEGRAEELLAIHTDRLSWRVYRTLCQLRFGYLSFLVVMGILMFSFTLLMEIFFAIFLPSVRTFSTEFIVRSLVFLILLPVLLFVLSYVFEEALRLFIDGINHHDGGLPNFRLALAVVIHYVRHRNTFKQQQDDNQPGDSKTSESISKSLFISEKDDPFADPPEENDADHDEPEVDPGHDDEEGSADDNESPSPARRRWKRAAGAVIATNILKKPLFDGPPVALSTYLMVDIVCPVVFELATITAFVIELIDSWSIYSAFLNYVRAGFWLMAGYLVVWIVCHFWSSRNAHMRLMVSHYRRKRRSLQREVRKIELDKRSDHLWLLDLGFRFSHHVAYHIKSKVSSTCCPRQRRGAPAQPDIEATTPFHSMEGNHVSLAIDDQSSHTHGTVRAKLRAKNPWHRLSHGKQASILLLGCVIAAIVSFWYFGVGWPLLGVCLILLSRVIQRRFPQIFGKAFRHFIVAFVVLSLVFFSSTWIVGTFVSGGDFHLGAPTSDTLATANSTSAMTTSTTSVSQTIEYPVCTIDYNGLTILDMALIADAAYGSTPELQASAISNRFNGTALSTMTIVNHSTSSDNQMWFELFAPSVNMTIIAIRGTASAEDALEDLHFWFGITIMQAVNMFIPFLKQLPHDFVVGLLSMKVITTFMPAPVYEQLEDHVKYVRSRVGDRLVVTGHSLGGAMAAMTGAKAQASAVSFSGPGLLYSRGRFDVAEQDLRDYVLTLKPQRDIVPQVDALGGLVQELRCREKSPMSCHSTYTHLCELYLACGDTRNRDWSTAHECTRYKALPQVPRN